MPESRFAGRSYFLEGPEGREPLAASYDDAADVLYLWRGEEPSGAISFPTDDGPVVRVHPDTGELVGVTLLDWWAVWAARERIEVSVPVVGRSEREAVSAEPAHRELVAV